MTKTDNSTLSIAEIDLSKIRIDGRLRDATPENIGKIKASMSDFGLHSPINVRSLNDDADFDYELIDGGHRLLAAQELEWETIPAIVLELDNAAAAQVLEINANLSRVDLNALDRGQFLATLKRIYVEANPDTRQGIASVLSRSGKKTNLVFSNYMQAQMGSSKTAINRDIRIYEALGPTVIEQIKATSIADHQQELEALSRLDEKSQKQAVKKVLTEKAGSIREAIRAMTDTTEKASDPEKEVNALFKKFTQLTGEQKAAFFSKLANRGYSVTSVTENEG